MNRPKRETILWAVVLMAAFMHALAAPADAAPQTFPFGLEKLQWKMSYAEVKALLSSSIPEMKAPPIGAPHTDHQEYFWGPLAFKDCTLQIWTFFANGQLDYIYVGPAYVGAVRSPVTEACKTAMQDELIGHFGETARNQFISPVTHRNMGTVMKWKTPETLISYGNARVNLQEVGSPGLTITDFAGPPGSK